MNLLTSQPLDLSTCLYLYLPLYLFTLLPFEHFLKVSSKSNQRNSRYIEKGIFWDQKWPNLGLNDGHAWARMGEHVTKLISLHSLYTKNISSKFRRNLMKRNRYMLERPHFGHHFGPIFGPFGPKRVPRDFFLKNLF